MANTAKRKGDRTELEVQSLIQNLTGWPARRKLGAGRMDDMGDIDGVPDTTVQVVNYRDISRALAEKVPQSQEQQARAGTTFGCTFVRRPRGGFYVVMTPEQWATYAREAQ